MPLSYLSNLISYSLIQVYKQHVDVLLGVMWRTIGFRQGQHFLEFLLVVWQLHDDKTVSVLCLDKNKSGSYCKHLSLLHFLHDFCSD